MKLLKNKKPEEALSSETKKKSVKNHKMVSSYHSELDQRTIIKLSVCPQIVEASQPPGN